MVNSTTQSAKLPSSATNSGSTIPDDLTTALESFTLDSGDPAITTTATPIVTDRGPPDELTRLHQENELLKTKMEGLSALPRSILPYDDSITRDHHHSHSSRVPVTAVNAMLMIDAAHSPNNWVIVNQILNMITATCFCKWNRRHAPYPNITDGECTLQSQWNRCRPCWLGQPHDTKPRSQDGNNGRDLPPLPPPPVKVTVPDETCLDPQLWASFIFLHGMECHNTGVSVTMTGSVNIRTLAGYLLFQSIVPSAATRVNWHGFAIVLASVLVHPTLYTDICRDHHISIADTEKVSPFLLSLVGQASQADIITHLAKCGIKYTSICYVQPYSHELLLSTARRFKGPLCTHAYEALDNFACGGNQLSGSDNSSSEALLPVTRDADIPMTGDGNAPAAGPSDSSLSIAPTTSTLTKASITMTPSSGSTPNVDGEVDKLDSPDHVDILVIEPVHPISRGRVSWVNKPVRNDFPSLPNPNPFSPQHNAVCKVVTLRLSRFFLLQYLETAGSKISAKALPLITDSLIDGNQAFVIQLCLNWGCDVESFHVDKANEVIIRLVLTTEGFIVRASLSMAARGKNTGPTFQ
ncbi:uncharacterized protein EV420DRAFT_1485637 [Desarmillaria tabescens]|uniref:Uncharacterized protein n=1 Tax=Armillaria tabescens TaxID=1929756 RepID=A0AA39JEW0_ARMTA|nr:uncharacterized protein EV420DRAFT_1485637 [Desarmillaria tabescens]KAK0441471.1 hypothetical protein EV420DRAFT_1485637 [Desarmillaria tabescens]